MSVRTRLLVGALGLIAGKPLSERSLAEIRRARRLRPPRVFPFDRVFGRVPPGVRWHDEPAATRGGSVRARVYEPASRRRPSPLVVFFHGGGWVYGSVQRYDALCAQVAHRVGAVVVSADYRLAPEHVFPAAVEDCYDVTAWAVGQADALGIDPARVAVLGDSAGGNLAAVVCQVARERGGPSIAFQALLYPSTDATLASPSIAANADAPVLTRRDIRDFLARYLPDGDPTDPRISPLLSGSLADLPPTLIQTAELDPLLDDGARYAQALRDADVPVRYTEYAEVPHGFASFPGVVPCGEQSLRELASELARALR